MKERIFNFLSCLVMGTITGCVCFMAVMIIYFCIQLLRILNTLTGIAAVFSFVLGVVGIIVGIVVISFIGYGFLKKGVINMDLIKELVKFLGIGLFFLVLIIASCDFLYNGIVLFIEISTTVGWYAILHFFGGLICVILGILLLMVTGWIGSIGLDDLV